MEMNETACICNKCGYNFEELKEESLILCPHCKEIKKIQDFNLIEE